MDTTFGIRPNWARLTQSKHSAHGAPGIKHAAEPLPKNVLAEKTVDQLVNYQSWRKASPLNALSPARLWHNYQVKHMFKNYSAKPIIHFSLACAALHYVLSFSHLSTIPISLG